MTTLITPLPTPPTRQDSANFNDRADDFLGALPLFQQEANSLAIDVQSSADEVEIARQAVASISNVTKWVSGNTYSEGVSVWSPINGIAYRKITSSSGGTTDPSLDDVNYKSITDASGFIYRPAGTSAVATTVQKKLQETLSVSDKGAVSLATINAAIADVSDGKLTIPPGTYSIVGDILISEKNRGATSGPHGSFEIDATGVSFTGSGKIIIDSSKRVVIRGLDAPNHDLCFRGVWWSDFHNMRFRYLFLGDASGTVFSDNYWNTFHQCQAHGVGTATPGSTYNNKFDFFGCSLRGSALQGFSETADYAFNFAANADAQGWVFHGGDISYHNLAVVNIANDNISDVEIEFHGTYFDSLLPTPTDRNNTRIITRNCHHANGTVYAATIPQFTAGSVDLYRSDRQWTHNASQGVNLIPNGDFRQTLTVWAGTGLPIGSLNSAEVTHNSGGISGVYLNVNQSLTTGNSVRFRAKSLPSAGRATATLIVRNAVVGNKTMALSFAGLSPTFSISNTEWSVIRITSGSLLTAGSVNDLQVYTNDGTAFNVDIAYVGISLGQGSDMVVPSYGFRTIDYSESYDVPAIAAGSQTFKDFTVAGASLGDFALISSSSALSGLQITANVNATNTVRMVLQNNTASQVDLGSAVWYVRIWRRQYE